MLRSLPLSILLTTVFVPHTFALDPPNPLQVRFERHQFSVNRLRGKILVDGRQVSHDVVQSGDQRVRLIETFDDLKFESDHAFRKWASGLRSPRTYTYDIVIAPNPDGSVTRVPLVLLPRDQQKDLGPQWQAWLADQSALKRQAEQRRLAVQRQTKTTSPTENSSVPATSLTRDTWLVRLTPQTTFTSYGFTSPFASASTIGFNNVSSFAAHPNSDSEISVTVDANDSQAAIQSAMSQYPKHRLVSARKIINRSFSGNGYGFGFPSIRGFAVKSQLGLLPGSSTLSFSGF